MISLRECEDAEEVREWHSLAFPGDAWCGDHNTFWLARNGKKIVGFCCAVYFSQDKSLHLTRAAVTKDAKCSGLQRRMIRVREAWGRKLGATFSTTYTSLKNYPSMVNLLKCGYRFKDDGDPKWHLFRKEL